MIEPFNLAIAIPDSALSDEMTKRDKSIKVSQFARACSIFRVNQIYIYHDDTSPPRSNDYHLLKTLLCYLDTPQYLRKQLFPHMKELEFAGILHPLKSPHHKQRQDAKDIKIGDIRVGVIVDIKGSLYVNAGLEPLVKFIGPGVVGQKVNIKFTSIYPILQATEADEKDIKGIYWGYKVNAVPSLLPLLKRINDSEIVITSRKGACLSSIEPKFVERIKSTQRLLVIFGSPQRGIPEMLTRTGYHKDKNGFMINMFPFQGTATVRLEEAMLGTLAIVNHILNR